jgi:hypothetical protein
MLGFASHHAEAREWLSRARGVIARGALARRSNPDPTSLWRPQIASLHRNDDWSWRVPHLKR